MKEDSDKIMKLCRSPAKRLSYSFAAKQQWNPRGKQANYEFLCDITNIHAAIVLDGIWADCCFSNVCVDPQHMSAVKEALHVSTVPCSLVCREDEQQRVLEFCKGCVQQGKAGSLYICGCPGTGKSLSMEKVKQNLLEWAQDVC